MEGTVPGSGSSTGPARRDSCPAGKAGKKADGQHTDGGGVGGVRCPVDVQGEATLALWDAQRKGRILG